MARREAGRVPPDYDQNVFINCPFDDAYRPLFQALIFAVFACGLRPRCAQEVYDAGEVRIDKIARIIGDCRWGIHDISRTDLNQNGLPRFNMPLELGLFLGGRRFGDSGQPSKSCLILDPAQYRFQQFITDIAGQDIAAHTMIRARPSGRSEIGSRPSGPGSPTRRAGPRSWVGSSASRRISRRSVRRPSVGQMN